MSRDFLVICATSDEAAQAAERLALAVTNDGIPLFEIENRGTDLFVMLTYPREIKGELQFKIGEDRFLLAEQDVAFVALKNGEHSGIGYFVDTGIRFDDNAEMFPLTDLLGRVTDAFGS